MSIRASQQIASDFPRLNLTEEQVMKSAKPLLAEKMDALSQHGLLPFFAQNKAPALVIPISFFKHCHAFTITL